MKRLKTFKQRFATFNPPALSSPREAGEDFRRGLSDLNGLNDLNASAS
jgi:hypothetical protein